MVVVICDSTEIQAQANLTVAQVRNLYSHALNLAPDDKSLVNGRVVQEDMVLAEEDILEFLKPGVIDNFLDGRGRSKNYAVRRRARPEQAPEFLSLKDAAGLTSLSYSHVRRAVLSGELPASNIGSTRHPVYRIARKELAAWMEKKKGGSLKVPPKSELKELKDRYFPD